MKKLIAIISPTVSPILIYNQPSEMPERIFQSGEVKTTGDLVIPALLFKHF